MTIKEWFERYIKEDLDDLKILKEELIYDYPEEAVEENQLTGLNLAIVTMERNPDYSDMFKNKKKKEKGSYVKGRGFVNEVSE